MEKFIAQPGETVNTTELSTFRGPVEVLSVYRQGDFCYYEVTTPGATEKMTTLRNKDILAVIL